MTTRRRFIALQSSDRYKNLLTEDYLVSIKLETQVEDTDIFTEGPAVDGKGDVYFTNIRTSKILKWNPRERELSTFLTDTNEANGLRFTPDGNLLICEGGAGQVTRLNMSTGQKTTVADQFKGKMLQAPNDIEYDRSGRIYFSSRGDQTDPNNYNKKAVYRLDPDGSLHQLLSEPDVHMPNGLVISPDESTLYLIEAHPNADHNRCILAFDLRDGELSNRRTLINFYPGRSGDGMCIDREGNLYVAAGLHAVRGTSETLDTKPGIHVISPEGKLLAYLMTPQDTITNCTFGGADLKTLYITAGPNLISMQTKIAGKDSYRLG